MAASTGPILATGGITFVNQWIGNGQSPDYRILVATGIAAAGFYALEKASPELAVGIAWIALITSLLIKPKTGNSAVNNALRLTGLGKS
jgi:hypothetical protein